MKRSFVFVFVFLFLFSAFVSGLSNESINYHAMVLSAQEDVNEIISKGLSTERINESYAECLQFYNLQVGLEESNKRTDYGLVNKSCTQVKTIKEFELEATDEILVFIDEYNSMNASFNLSSMDDIYFDIVSSYENERFEDTLEFIPQGYEALTSIQSSQTALNLFYQSTSLGIKNFFYKNWKIISIILCVLISLWLMFRKRILLWNLRRQITSLEIRKSTIKVLMERLQKDYFGNKKISQNEYDVKMKSFTELTLDISRQILLAKEALSKLGVFEKSEDN